jgi:hypothetical protein
MKSHYTILSAAVRPEIDEKLTIGLLLVYGNEVYFEYSKNKLSSVKTLIDPSLCRYLTESLRQIEKVVELENSKKGTTFEADSINHQFTEGYLSYMSRYSNNLLIFSSPVQIDKPSDASLFDFLYKKYVDSVGVPEKKTKAVQVVKEEFYPKVKNYYNTNFKITPKLIPGLPLTVDIDVVGKNEIEVFAQIIDFERKEYNIRQDVLELDSIINVYGVDKTKNFIVGNEPDKKIYATGYNLWQELRTWRKAEFVAIDEIDKLKEYAEKHGVKPLFAIEN